MTIDAMLVSRRAPTMVELRAAVAAASRRTELGAAELAGDWDDGHPLVELSAEVSAGELLAQLFRPSVSLTTAADDYTVRIGLAPPLDDDGHCWLTGIATAGTATDPQVRAVLDVLATLAVQVEGFLVVDGKAVELDGVPAPRRLAVAAAPPKSPPRNRVFVDAFLTTPAAGEQGWTWSMNLLREVLSTHLDDPDLRPRYLEQDGEWRSFLPSAPMPEWWPLGQYLLTPQPYLKWQIDPAAQPHDRFTKLAAAGDLDPAVAESFLPDLITLAAGDLVYGLVHAWHDDEPLGPTGLRQGRNGPWLLLTPRDLVERLPDLYWAQIFGPPWVELFGAQTLASTPGHRVEEVTPGHWLVQLTEHLSDVVTTHAAFDDARQAAKKHLGEDAFFSRERGPRGTYRAASVPTLDERGLTG